MTSSLSAKLKSANVLMTLLIIAHHSNVMEIYPVTILTDVAVPSFFCISSFLYFQNWEPNRAFYVKKIRSRVKSLLIPYLLYNFLFYIYYLIKQYAFHLPVPKDIPIAPWDALICIVSSVPDGPLWFIRELMVFVVTAPLFAMVIRKSKFGIVFLVVIGIIMAQYVGYTYFLHWIPCFSTGCFFALYQKEVTRWYEAGKDRLCNRILFCNPAFPIAVVILCSFLFQPSQSQSLPYYLYRIMAPLLVILLYIKANPLPQKFVQAVSPYTFYAYGIHVLFIWNLHGLLQRLNYISEDEKCPLEVLFLFVCTLLLIYITGSILRKIPLVWSLLTGFRQ